MVTVLGEAVGVGATTSDLTSFPLSLVVLLVSTPFSSCAVSLSFFLVGFSSFRELKGRLARMSGDTFSILTCFSSLTPALD